MNRAKIRLSPRGTALPDDYGATVGKHRHASILLISSACHVDPERRLRPRKIVVQPQGADSPTVAVGHIVLPHDKTAIGAERNGRENLITGKRTGQRRLACKGQEWVLSGAGKRDHRGKHCGHKAFCVAGR